MAFLIDINEFIAEYNGDPFNIFLFLIAAVLIETRSALIQTL